MGDDDFSFACPHCAATCVCQRCDRCGESVQDAWVREVRRRHDARTNPWPAMQTGAPRQVGVTTGTLLDLVDR